MSTELYRYTPRPGEWVAVHATGDAEESCELRVGGNPGMPYETAASIPDAAVPEVARGIVRAMHEAAGEPPPVILDRPGLPGGMSFHRDFAVEATEDGEVRVGLDGARRTMPPDGARRLAACIAGRADEAEAGQAARAAEVEALARVILAEMYAGPEAAEGAARAILAAGYRLTERTT